MIKEPVGRKERRKGGREEEIEIDTEIVTEKKDRKSSNKRRAISLTCFVYFHMNTSTSLYNYPFMSLFPLDRAS